MSSRAGEIETRVNRQQEWATRACDALREAYIPDCPALLLTYGWPRGMRGSYKKAPAVAVYHKAQTEADGVIFLIPTAWSGPGPVLRALAIEMIRAACGGAGADSRKVLKRAHAIGLDPVSTSPLNPDADAAFDQLAEMLGEFPAAPMPEIKNKGGGRLKRHACVGCNAIAYTSREVSGLECGPCREVGKPFEYMPAPFRGQEG